MDLEQLAAYLQRDARELSKLAKRGELPGQKIGGAWRFASTEINYWLEGQIPALGEEELAALERRRATEVVAAEPLVMSLISENTIATPLAASTRASVLRDLVGLAEQSWQIYDSEALLQAIKQREEIRSTALVGGIALPHPHRPLSPKAQGEAVIAFARSASAIPFGAPDNSLTDLFFLISCREADTHLRVLARLSRMMLRPGFLDELRGAATAGEALQIIDRAERALIES